MEIRKYINQKKKLYKELLYFLENEDKENFNKQNIFDILDNQKIDEDREEFKLFLHLISRISTNHHRSPNFIDKIKEILLFYKNKIKQTFSNSQIFNFFKYDKLILLYLFKNGMITIDEPIVRLIFQKKSQKYCHFFYPEIKDFLNEEKRERFQSDLSNFDENREKGENDSYLCGLIRDDSIVEFVSFYNQTNFSLSSEVKPSIFETNSFLLKNEKTKLIEYAAFFGSIQIFRFLLINNVEMPKSLWLYAIHSNNADLIHILEENHIEPEDKSYEKCLEESIKCHHNEIAIYLSTFLITNEFKFNKNILSYSFHYNDYEHFSEVNQFIFYYACQYDYLPIVKICLNTMNININSKIISKS